MLLTIGRIGRSIGMHLLLSSQRIESGRLRGLETYLSYRIGLRTFSEAESTVVLDTPDAHRAYAALKARGVEFTGEVREDPWGTSASFVDPDGNGWVLMQVPER